MEARVLFANRHIAEDERDAINESNIIEKRTRGAKPQGVGYSEGPDENDLPEEARTGNSGRSDIRS
jgi:hypothetical protein